LLDDLKVGMTERPKKTIASSDVVGFAQLTGDRNPIHCLVLAANNR
jgi:3-hydroxybutyryl-CoA dehydratase